MMLIDTYELTAFTNFSENICLKIIDCIQRVFGEIGDFYIEDNEVNFRVYREYFINAPTIINDRVCRFELIEKSDYFFSLSYKINLSSLYD